MNKNLYRIVFNKARNMFMAVAENVRSQSKAAGQSSSSEIVSYGQSSGQEKSFHQLWHVKALVTSMSLLVPFAPVYADIVADSAANAANRAVIAAGKNSAGTTVPVVNIQTPKNGISHNIYKQFDVLAEGAVLNNSRQGATTKTVGAVAANPFLATGEARVILNEVNSTVASRFEGNLEVAGQMADVIIANPSGINIKGGGFINANKAIFTTGKPQLNADGSIKQFTVDQGKITVSANLNSKFGLGGNNNDANYVDLYARALELSAELRAKNDIQVIAGANNVSADLQDVTAKTGTGTAPTLAVDVKALGGMYANNIYLMGTEKGLGVTNAGTLQAVNNLVITSAGKIEHSGTISSTSKTQGLVSVQTTGVGVAADINSSGSINSNGMLNIDSGNNLNVNAKEIIINNGSLASSPLIINTKGNLNLAANSRIFNDAQSGELYVDAANINLATNAGITSNRGSAYIQSQKDVVAAQGAKLIAAQNLNVSGRGKLSLNENQIQASLGSINLQVDSSNTDGLIDIRGGTIYGGKDLNLYSSGDVNLQNLGFALENSVTRVKNINAHSGRNLVWNNATKVLPQITGKVALDAENNLSLSSQGFSSKGGIQLQADQLTLNTALTSQNNISLTAEIADLVLDNALTAQNDINVTALAGNLKTFSLKANSIAGKISLLANKDVNLSSMQHFDSMASYDVITTDKTNISGAKGVVVGSTGEGALSISATDIMANQGDVQLISNNGLKILANNDVSMHNDDNGRSVLSPTTITAQNININNKKNDLVVDNGTSFIAANELKINSEGKLNFKNSILNSKGNTEISSKDHLTLLGVTANSDKHLALSSKKNIYINGEYGTTTVWTPYVESNLTAKGILSMTSGGSHAAQNTTYTGGAISLEAGNVLTTPSNATLTFNAVDSAFLRSDPALKDLNGDLTIQTNGALTLDPKIHKLSVVGDLELISKNGKLTLLGYGGTNGNSSETVFKLFNGGGSHLEGNKGVEIQGSTIRNFKDVKIIAPTGDIKIEGVKNTFNNYKYSKHISDLIYQRIYYQDRIQALNNLGALNAAQKKLVAQYTEEVNDITQQLNFLASGTNGAEHAGSLITSGNGKINIVSGKGIMITGATIQATDGDVNIEAQGIGEKIYTSTALDKNSQPMSMNAGVILAAHNDFYDRGNETDQNYQAISLLTPTLVDGKRGVNIKTTGTQEGSNLILQAVSINSSSGDVKIESNKNILFDVALEQSYDRSTSIEKKKSWGGLKKKTITTFSENESTRPASVDISGKNIYIESKELNKNHKIDIYSGQFIAEGGDLFIRSGGDLYFNTVNEISKNHLEINKRSSILGIKYNTSKTNSSYQVVTQIPSTLTASYIGTKSGFDTHLAGTEFNYLKEATIESGGKIFLEPSVTSINNTIKKEKNSVVWQSMQDKGSITETAKLPSFNGPVAPTFKAAGGLAIQVPVKDDVRSALDTLVNQQGTTYLKDLVLRNDVDWQAVKLAQQQWDYKSQGLTPAAAAIIVIIITVATYGYGAQGAGAALFQTSSATSSAMANAAVASMASQAAISLANNGGDPLKALKSLGSSEYIKSLAVSVLSAGALSAVGGTAMMQNLEKLKQSGDLVQKIIGNTAQALVNSTIGAGINTAVSGNSLSENLENYLASGVMTALQGTMAQYIKPLESQGFSIEYVLHKIAHAAAGCGAAAATKQSCEAGAIGAGVSEVAAEYLRNPKVFESVDDALAYKNQIVEVSKGIAGAVAVVTGYDSTTAMASADNALKNNFVFLAAVPTAGEALVGLTLGAIRTCATNAACVSRAAQLGISVSATLAANSNSTDDKKVVKPISVSSGGGTATPPPEDEDKIKEILEKTSPGRATKGRTTQYEKQGDYSTAQKDFNSLQPKDIRTISGPNNQTGWVGKLNDGRIVNVRNWSSNNEITLEIQSGSKVIKIRYSK
ncbi:two-partner secretion domain-containing protein [Acinetobacter baumannii]|uniref:two-partner secretion domain-containing protein n=1 Tax=Acinetobacter baumannii TaxID=470 RepID=UPI00207B4B16|nr:DUF637 domain-containing protein [Acinetobacter baumannii]